MGTFPEERWTAAHSRDGIPDAAQEDSTHMRELTVKTRRCHVACSNRYRTGEWRHRS